MTLKNKLAPSVMCCDLLEVKPQIELFERTGIDLLHVDVMDGHFVPNLTLGTDFVRRLSDFSSIPLDVHLMTEDPDFWIDALIAMNALKEGLYVSVHAEAARHLQRTLVKIHATGAKALLALNPGTPLVMAEEVTDVIDGLLIMTVNPGFAGQKVTSNAFDKIARARAFLDAHGRPDAEIEVDGNVSIPNAIRMRDAGANIFVAGTASIFRDGMEQNIYNFRKEVFGE